MSTANTTPSICTSEVCNLSSNSPSRIWLHVGGGIHTQGC